MTYLKKIFSVIKTTFTGAFSMLSAIMTETFGTLAILSETLDIREWLGDIIRFQKPAELTNSTEHENLQKTILPEVEGESSSKNSEHDDLQTNVAPTNNKTEKCTFNEISDDECDVSQERLVETVENKIDQLTLHESQNTFDKNNFNVYDTSEILLCETNEEIIEQENNSTDNESSESENYESAINLEETNKKLVDRENIDDLVNITDNNKTNVICEKHTEICESDLINEEKEVFNTNSSKTEILTNFSQNSTNSTEISHDLNKSSINSTITTRKFSSNETDASNLVETESNDLLKNDEFARQKNISSSSWNAQALIEYLYGTEHHSIPKTFVTSKECYDGYITILPYGSFIGEAQKVFAVLENDSMFIWEHDDKVNLLFFIPLQYAEFEEQEDAYILDNRLGKQIKIKFNSEEELELWEKAFRSQTLPYKYDEFLEPILFPLKCHKNVVIIDLGSCSTRAGILMDQPTLPTFFCPTVCATNKVTGEKTYGINALSSEMRKDSMLSYPVRPSHFVKLTIDVPTVKGLIVEIFRQLNINPEEYALLLCVPRYLCTETQGAILDFLLNELQVKAVSLARQALMTLYASNTATGVVVDIGERLEILPVVDGYILETGVSRYPIGGETMIHHLKYVLEQQHVCLSSEVETLIVQYLLQKFCYFSANYQEEFDQACSYVESVRKTVMLHKLFNLQKDVLQNITLDISRFHVPEGLFQPDLWGIDCPGVHKLVKQAIITSGLDMRRIMAENIYISGGVTLIPGFAEKLESKVAELIQPTIKAKVHASPYRYHMAFIGACQLALSNGFSEVCVNSIDWNKNRNSCLKKWIL